MEPSSDPGGLRSDQNFQSLSPERHACPSSFAIALLAADIQTSVCFWVQLLLSQGFPRAHSRPVD